MDELAAVQFLQLQNQANSSSDGAASGSML